MMSKSRLVNRIVGNVLTLEPVVSPKVSRLMNKNRLFFVRPDLKAFTLIMRTRFICLPILLLTASLTFAAKPTPAPKAAATATPAPTISKPGVDQTAQTIIYCYHRLVDKVRFPGTEITPQGLAPQTKGTN